MQLDSYSPAVMGSGLAASRRPGMTAGRPLSGHRLRLHAEFLADDPGWPQPEGDGAVDGPAESAPARAGERAPLDAPLRDRVRVRVTNPPLRLQVRIDGEVTGRYPRTGEPMTIKASTQPKFKAGKGLKDAVN